MIIGELGSAYKIKPLENRYIGAALAVVPSMLLALLVEDPGRGPGSGGFLLWPLFGATNQLVGGLTLLVATIFLRRAGRPIIYTAIPMVFLICVTTASMVLNFSTFVDNPLLLVLSAVILALEVWLILEAIIAYNRQRNYPGGEPQEAEAD